MSNTAARVRTDDADDRDTVWHVEDIKAAVRKRTSFKELDQKVGLKPGACIQALRRQWPKCERAIADVIGVEPKDLWPDRYNEDGTPRGPRREQAARDAERQARARRRSRSAA